MNKILKSETFFTLLIALNLLMLLIFIHYKWNDEQSVTLNKIYLQQQALQIAENQIALKMTEHMPCESEKNYNNIKFTISCKDNEINISYPSGKITLSIK